MTNIHAPKVQRILGVALAPILLLALTVGLNGQPVAQARAQAEDLSTSVERVSSAAIGTVFSYQGRLDDGGSPANGLYTFRFRLYASLTGTDQVGDAVFIEDKQVSAGLFSVQLDFGQVFDGTALYLETSVRPAGETGEFDVLSPRQPLNPAPYALHAASIADGAVTASSIGEPCGEGQVLARSGGAWSCADAALNLAPQQLVSHTVQIGSATYAREALQANLLTLGGTSPDGLLLTCLQPCDDLNYHYYQCITIGACSMPTITVTVQSASSLQYWVSDSCGPNQLSTALSPDGHDLYPVFAMGCGTRLIYP